MQQGDPLGLVLFALAVHSALAEARAATEASHPGGIDLCSFFLDDGFCTGCAPAVRCFLAALIEGFRRIGLTVNLDKTEVIPACSSTQSFCPGDFQSNERCGNRVGRRVGKSRALLSAIGRFPDAQGAFGLMISCSGWSKVLYSWLFSASLPAGSGPGVLQNMVLPLSSPVSACWEALRGTISSGANIYAVSDSPSQKSLSGMHEARSVSVSCSGCWRVAHRQPVNSHVLSPLFRVALQRSLRMPLWDQDSACSMCGEDLTVGVVTPSLVAAVEIEFCATTQSAMWSAPRSLSSRRSRLGLRSLASSSPPKTARSWRSPPRCRPLLCFFPSACRLSPPCRCMGSQGRVWFR